MQDIAWLSTFFLSACGIPELLGAIGQGKVGASWGLLILWWLGEIAGLIYVSHLGDIALMSNYGLNGVIVSALLLLKWRCNGKC